MRRARLLPFPHPAWDSEGGRRGSFLRQPRVPAVGAIELGRGREVRAPFAPPSTAQHVYSSQKLSVSSAGGAKSESLSRPLQRRNASVQAKNCQGANFPFLGAKGSASACVGLRRGPTGVVPPSAQGARCRRDELGRGREVRAPFAPLLKPGMPVFKPKQAGRENLLFGCERLGFCLRRDRDGDQRRSLHGRELRRFDRGDRPADRHACGSRSGSSRRAG